MRLSTTMLTLLLNSAASARAEYFPSPLGEGILLIPQDRRRLGAQRPPGHREASGDREHHGEKSGEECRAPGEDPGHFQDPEAQEPRPKRSDSDTEDSGSQAQYRIFDDEGLDELDPR